MSHPLEARMARIRRRARRLVLMHALGRLAAMLVAVVIALVLIDWLIQFEDRGVRTIASLAALAVAAWALVRFVWPALHLPLGQLHVALGVERTFPQLNDRLASTVEFLGQSEHDPYAGSPALRRAVIAQATAEIEQLDLDQAFETRPAYRSAAAALAVCGLAFLLVVLNPALATVGLTRLANPLGDAQWPKANHLAFVKPPQRIALGQPFEVEVVDDRGARLPDEVFIQFRYEGQTDDDPAVEPMRLIGKQMLARKEQVTRPFSYRAFGGDDHSMRWFSLEVVEPPAVEQLSVKLHYPGYTGWPPAEADPHIRALVGTRVEISARTTKPLQSAWVRTDGSEYQAKISDDGYSFSLSAEAENGFIVAKSGAYWFDLLDREGFPGGQQLRYELRAVDDLPPTVSVDEPSANVFLTPDAVVPLRVAVKDDLAIHKVTLHTTRSDRSDEGETLLTLFEGPATISHSPAMDADRERLLLGDSRLLERQWDLAPLDLPPGSELTLHATATDYRPQVGQSHPRRLSIITPEDLTDRLAERQTFILNELARVLKLQRDARQQVSGIEIQLQQLGRLEKTDVDQLQSAQLTQRQVDRTLSGPDGVASQVRGLLADLANNKVDSPDIQRRMQGLLDEMNRLGEVQLPLVARHLTAAVKQAQAQLPTSPDAETPPAGSSPAKALDSAGRQQDAVIQSLEQLLGELSQWDNYRRFYQEIGQLRRDQQQLNQDTTELGRQTLTRDVKDLEPRQQAELKKLSARQLELARRFDKIQERMQQMASELEATEPLAAGTISDALQQARSSAVGGGMREAGRQLEQNQVAQAAGGQNQVDEDLQEMLDILANRREHELARLVKKLAEAEQQLDKLRQQQAGLTKKWREAAEKTDDAQRRRELERLVREQQQAMREAEQFARALKRLQADQAGRSTDQAGGRMGQAGEQGQQGEAGSAADQAAAAEQDLQQAQEQLSRQRRQAQIDLAAEQLARLEDGLGGIRDRQARLLEETVHYDSLRQSQGQWTRSQMISVADLAQQQAALEQETGALAEKLAAAEVFNLGLKTTAGQMAEAARLLDQRDLGTTAQQAEQRVLARLEQMIDALKPDSPGNQAQNQGGQPPPGQAGEGQPGGQQAGGIRFLSELKLLKLMQQDINLRTEALEQARRGRQLTQDQRQEYAALSEEQGQVADLLLNLTQPAEADSLDVDDLPDIEPADAPASTGEPDPDQPLVPPGDIEGELELEESLK